ncbi:MAG: gliding motility lipoprotein GldB [Bacteroidota bacterium]
MLVFHSCRDEDKIAEEISKIDVDITVERFDRVFATAKPSDLGKIKNAFPFLFSKRMPDSIMISRMEDTLQKQLLNEVDRLFGDFVETEGDIERLFRHLKYYDKTFSIPKVVTLTNDVDYRFPVIVTDTLVLIALDNYLNPDHEFYANISDYIKQDMTKKQIMVDLAEEYAKQCMFPTKMKNFLEEMIYFGKILYFKDKVIPYKSDAEKIGYTQSQLDFSRLNEEMIWTHFVENEMLFDNDNSLVSRFIADAPFSKFYLSIDNETPGRLGQFIGWQIVRAYAENNEIELMKLMETDPNEIFNKSNYKPAK